MKIMLLIGMISVQFVIFAQPSIQWQHCYGGSNGDAAYSIAIDYDGFIVAGLTGSDDIDVVGHHGLGCPNSNCFDFWLVKTDFNGSILWQKCFGGTDQDVAYSVISTSDSGYLTCGVTFSNDGDVTGNHPPQNVDCWVVKSDHLGNIIWQKCYGGNSVEIATSATQTSDGGFAIFGYTYSNDGDVIGHHADSTTEDMWVIKIDPIGNIQWQKCLGGTGDQERGMAIRQTIDGGYAVFGTAASYWGAGDVVGIHGNHPDCWLVKLDSSGNIIGQNCYGGYLDYQLGFSMDATFDNGFILAGVTSYDTGMVSGYHGNSNNLTGDAYIIKVDSSGNVQHEKCFGGTNAETCNSIKQTIDGGYVFTGTTNSNDGDINDNHGWPDIYVIKLDTAFNIQWEKCLGGTAPEESFSILQTQDSGFVIAGYTLSNDGDVTLNHGGADLWLVKLSGDPLTVAEYSGEINKLNVYADQNTGTFELDFISDSSSPINIDLFDVTGREILHQVIKRHSGENHFKIYQGKLSSGMYFLSLYSNKIAEFRKLVLE